MVGSFALGPGRRQPQQGKGQGRRGRPGEPARWRAEGESARVGEVARCCPAAPFAGVWEVLRAPCCGGAMESRRMYSGLPLWAAGNGCSIGPTRECNKIRINLCISVYLYILILSPKSWVCLGIQGHTPAAAHVFTAGRPCVGETTGSCSSSCGPDRSI